MLPGNLQYWKPCSFLERMMQTLYFGSKDFYIEEPVHFSGPSPKDPADMLAIIEEEEAKEEEQEPDKSSETSSLEEDKIEEPQIPQSAKTTVAVKDDPLGQVRQADPVETAKNFDQEKKRPMFSQIVKPTEGSERSAITGETQEIIHVFQTILSEQLDEKLNEQREKLREELKEELEVNLRG